MSTASLVEFFMLRRKCSFSQAERMAERVIIRRKFKAEQMRLAREHNQTILPLDADPLPVPQVDDPTITF